MKKGIVLSLEVMCSWSTVGNAASYNCSDWDDGA